MKTKIWFLLFAILTLSVVFRFFNLSSNPPSLDWDEASLGWNAYSLLKTGSDEYGVNLPLSIKSFNDYKPPLYVYFTQLPVLFFGLNEFSVRFVSAVAGSLLAIVAFGLASLLGKKTGLMAAFLTAVCPWMIHFSRGAFEANLGLFVLYFGLALCATRKTAFYLIGNTLILLSVYAYHSNRLVAPLIFILFNLFLILTQKIYLRKIIGLILILPFILIPFFYVMIFGHGLERINAVGIGNLSLIVASFFNHFGPNFLFITGDGNPRHTVFPFALLYPVEIIPLVFGFFQVLKNWRKLWLPASILFISLVPSALTVDSPHAIRSLIGYPGFLFLIVLGMREVYNINLIKVMLIMIYAVMIFAYGNSAFKHYPVESAAAWQYGYRELVSELNKSGIYARYQKIVVTNSYDQPYIYFLFYNQNKFLDYKNDGTANLGFDKLIFKKIVPEDLANKKEGTVIVGTPSEVPDQKNSSKIIYYPDKQPVFKILQ